MKSYYCFIQNYQQLHVGSFIYKVGVGTSQRDQVKLSLVTQYCRDCGCYFHIWSDKVLADIDAAARPFKSTENVYSRPFRHDLITIQDLYQMIMDDTFSFYEANKPANPFEIWITYRNNPEYISSQNKKPSITKCPTFKRKNLSLRKLDKGVREAV